jgi:hypothetical protein
MLALHESSFHGGQSISMIYVRLLKPETMAKVAVLRHSEQV